MANRDVAIVGVYLTEQARGIDRSSASLEIEAVKGALDDAGLKPSDVDGIGVTGIIEGHNDWGADRFLYWAEQLGGHVLKAFIVSPNGAATVAKAAALISSGFCDTVVSMHGKAHFHINPRKAAPVTKAPRFDDFAHRIHGASVVPWYAIWAQRYMHEFGVTSLQLAEIAAAQRYHATLNPKAIMGNRGEITVEDVVSSRVIASPLHLLDCCIDNDGGHAIVITTLEKAKSLKKKPIRVLGYAEGAYIDSYTDIPEFWFPKEGNAVASAADRTFAMAGVTRDDIDVAAFYDCFTIACLRGIEESGFCGAGEGGDFIQGGTIRLGGKLPTNTHGGLLSCSHNGIPGSMHVIEVARQLRGNDVEPQRQVKDAKLGFVENFGMAILGSCGTLVMAAD